MGPICVLCCPCEFSVSVSLTGVQIEVDPGLDLSNPMPIKANLGKHTLFFFLLRNASSH